MGPRQRLTFILTLAGFLLAASLPGICASVSNEGDDAVWIEFHRPGMAPRKETVYPGQSVDVPTGTKIVKVVPSYSDRGDENVLIRVRESNGNEGEITALGGSFELNKPEENQLQTIIYAPGKVTNYSNIIVTVSAKTATRSLPARTLYVEDSMTLSSDIKEVSIGSPRPLRGDEIVSVEVLMPDGETYTVGGLNTTLITAEPEETESEAVVSSSSGSANSASTGYGSQRKTYVGVGNPTAQKVKKPTIAQRSGEGISGGLENEAQNQADELAKINSAGRTRNPGDPDAETSLTYVENA